MPISLARQISNNETCCVNWFMPVAWILLPVGLLMTLAGLVLLWLGRAPDTPFVSVAGWSVILLGLPLALGSAWVWMAFR